MKQIMITGQGDIEIIDVPVPGKIPNSVLVRNSYSLISSGTERSAVTKYSGVLGLLEKAVNSQDRVKQVWEMAKHQGFNKTWGVVRNKLDDYLIPGYSCAGQVVEISDSNLHYRPGDFVACMGTGFATHSEYVVVPTNLIAPIRKSTDLAEAAFAALGCIAMQGIRRLEATPGEWIGVIGLGLIGQITCQLLIAMGNRVVGFDLLEERAKKTKQISGISAWGIHETNLMKRVLELTDGVGLDGVVICASSDSHQPVNQAFDLCREKGRVSLVGVVGLKLDRKKMYKKELDLRISRSYGPGRYDDNYEIKGNDYPISFVRWSENRNLKYFLELLDSGKLNLKPLISKKIAVGNAIKAYDLIKEKGENIYGVIIDYESSSVKKHRIDKGDTLVKYHSVKILNQKPEIIRLGIIGSGGFVKGIHLPNIKKMPELFDVIGIASRTGATACLVAKRFGIPIATSDYSLLLEDPNINAVLIATRHASHAQIVLDSLDAGKHVFVEKPMCITNEEGQTILKKVQETGLLLRVGFNRRFSPYLIKMRETIGRQGQRIFTCRVNIGSIEGDWSNSPEHGGRFLGEGVHFIDLCNWFLDSKPIGMSSMIAGIESELNPNILCQIKYADGSIAQIIYTSIGNKLLGKECYEAFGNGISIKVDDFKKLESFGKKVRITRGEIGDKGHIDELREFSAALKGIDFPIEGADALAGLLATQMALSVFTKPEAEHKI